MSMPRRRSSALDAEDLRWRFYVGIAALACLAETVVAALDYLHPAASHALGRESLFGALFCALLLVALLSRRISLRSLDLATTGIVSLALAVELWHAWQQPTPPPARLYFIGLFVTLSAFTVLPLRLSSAAVAVILLTFGVLVLSRSGPHDLTLLIELAVATVLILHLAVFGRQASSERQEGRQFRMLAFTDALTGLDNRRAMYEHLAAALDARGAGTPFALLLVDLDHFKRVNDQHGHETGDEGLRATAQAIRSALHSGDQVARWGGEEFVVLLHGVGERTATQVAGQVCEAVRVWRQPGLPPLTVSIGVTVARPEDSISSLLQRADAHLYTAKHQGRDGWHAGTGAPERVA